MGYCGDAGVRSLRKSCGLRRDARDVFMHRIKTKGLVTSESIRLVAGGKTWMMYEECMGLNGEWRNIGIGREKR